MIGFAFPEERDKGMQKIHVTSDRKNGYWQNGRIELL